MVVLILQVKVDLVSWIQVNKMDDVDDVDDDDVDDVI